MTTENNKNTHKTILVVEDSPMMRKYIALSLKLFGYKVVLAVDGMDAMEKLHLQAIDLIITDINMPNMDGFKFIENVKLTDGYSNIPIIVLTSVADEESIKQSNKIGVNMYMVKPFSTKTIQIEVDKLI